MRLCRDVDAWDKPAQAQARRLARHSAGCARDYQALPERIKGRLDLVETRGMTPVE
jgi:hypothetical protein